METIDTATKARGSFWTTMLWLPVALGFVLLGAVIGFGVGHDRLVPAAMTLLVFVPPFWGLALFAWALENDVNRAR